VTGTPLAATFVYDWAGQRYSKTDGGVPPTIYSYALGGTLIAENDNGVVSDYVYVDGRPIAVLQPAATTAADQVNFVHADRLGTPQLVTNSSGTTVWSTTYQPFGTTGIVTAAINQNLRLPGQNYDAETGFNYNLNRDYVPYLGRYLESDPIGLAGGMNTYQYANGNPLTTIDAFGLSAILLPAPVSTLPDWSMLGATSISRGLSSLSLLLSLSGDTPQTFYHYTDQTGYQGIINSGFIMPSSDNNVYLTPDLYSCGQSAQRSLALSRIPVGFFIIPVDLLENYGQASAVAPANNQPGGGVEVKVPYPLPAGKLQWVPFSQPAEGTK
jgi:RHS repeat-associated protein